MLSSDKISLITVYEITKAAHSAYEMFSWYKYLIVSLVFSHLGFWSGSLFLIAHFPDLCLLVLFFFRIMIECKRKGHIFILMFCTEI